TAARAGKAAGAGQASEGCTPAAAETGGRKEAPTGAAWAGPGCKGLACKARAPVKGTRGVPGAREGAVIGSPLFPAGTALSAGDGAGTRGACPAPPAPSVARMPLPLVREEE